MNKNTDESERVYTREDKEPKRISSVYVKDRRERYGKGSKRYYQ